MKSPVLPIFEPTPTHQVHMLAAVARAHALQLEQLAEAAATMNGADLKNVDTSWLARELVELTQQAAVIEAAARRIGGAK